MNRRRLRRGLSARPGGGIAGVTPGPDGHPYQLSGGVADAVGGRFTDTFTLRRL